MKRLPFPDKYFRDFEKFPQIFSEFGRRGRLLTSDITTRGVHGGTILCINGAEFFDCIFHLNFCWSNLFIKFFNIFFVQLVTNIVQVPDRGFQLLCV